MTVLKAFGLATATFVVGLLLVVALATVGSAAGATDEDFVRFIADAIPWIAGIAIVVGVCYYITRELRPRDDFRPERPAETQEEKDRRITGRP